MQSSLLLIAASGLFQQPAAPVTPDTSIVRAAEYARLGGAPAWGWNARLGPSPRGEVPLQLPRSAFGFPVADSAQSQRPKAREYSSAYYTRLAIHRYASYATLPLFAAEYYVGQKLFTDTSTFRSGSTRSAHSILAFGIGALFAVNTVTGVWNLWEERKEAPGRARRYIHAALMLASDAGLLWTAASAPGGRERFNGTLEGNASHHRTLAIASFSTATVGYLMMLIWK
jgi:hypothetical protein